MPALLVNGASLSLFRYLAFRCFDSQIFPFTFFARPSIKFLQLAPDSCTATIGGKKGQLLIEKRIFTTSQPRRLLGGAISAAYLSQGSYSSIANCRPMINSISINKLRIVPLSFSRLTHLAQGEGAPAESVSSALSPSAYIESLLRSWTPKPRTSYQAVRGVALRRRLRP